MKMLEFWNMWKNSWSKGIKTKNCPFRWRQHRGHREINGVISKQTLLFKICNFAYNIYKYTNMVNIIW